MKLLQLIILTFIIFINSSQEGFAKIQVYPTQSQAVENSLYQSLKHLREAVKKKDAKRLLTLINPEIRCDVGNCTGYQDFINYWHLYKNPHDSMIWQHLNRILSLSGYFEDDSYSTYIMPSYFNHITTFKATAGDRNEPLTPQYGVIIGKGVWLRPVPSFQTSSHTKLDNEIVQILYDRHLATRYFQHENEQWQWKKVKTQNGLIGFVWGKYLYDNLQYRMGLRKVKGRWLIQYLLKGD